MTEHEAAAYRLAPDNMLDWLDDQTTAPDLAAIEHWEDHLDWLKIEVPRESDQRETQWPEPERS